MSAQVQRPSQIQRQIARQTQSTPVANRRSSPVAQNRDVGPSSMPVSRPVSLQAPVLGPRREILTPGKTPNAARNVVRPPAFDGSLYSARERAAAAAAAEAVDTTAQGECAIEKQAPVLPSILTYAAPEAPRSDQKSVSSKRGSSAERSVKQKKSPEEKEQERTSRVLTTRVASIGGLVIGLAITAAAAAYVSVARPTPLWHSPSSSVTVPHAPSVAVTPSPSVMPEPHVAEEPVTKGTATVTKRQPERNTGTEAAGKAPLSGAATVGLCATVVLAALGLWSMKARDFHILSMMPETLAEGAYLLVDAENPPLRSASFRMPPRSATDIGFTSAVAPKVGDEDVSQTCVSKPQACVIA